MIRTGKPDIVFISPDHYEAQLLRAEGDVEVTIVRKWGTIYMREVSHRLVAAVSLIQGGVAIGMGATRNIAMVDLMDQLNLSSYENQKPRQEG